LVSLYDDTDHMVLDVRDTGAAGKEETTARLRFSEGWYDLDQGPENWSYLSSGRGTIEIDDKFPEVLSFTADVSAVSPPDTIRIYIGGKLAWQGELAEAGPHQIGPISIPSKKGKTEIQIVNGKGPLHVGSDPRLLGFRLGNVKLNNNGVRVCQLQ
jgi:hypothetical protein